jgi:hypothetical protein
MIYSIIRIDKGVVARAKISQYLGQGALPYSEAHEVSKEDLPWMIETSERFAKANGYKFYIVNRTFIFEKIEVLNDAN